VTGRRPTGSDKGLSDGSATALLFPQARVQTAAAPGMRRQLSTGTWIEHLAGRVILLWGWRRAGLAFLAGAVAVLTQAPFDFFAAGFIAFPVLVWLVDGATPQPGANAVKRLGPAFAVGWCFGFGYFLAGLWWIGSALLVEADSFAWALPLAVVGIPVLLAFFYGTAVAVARLLWADGIGRIAALAFGFGLAEWLRSFLFTGFPWNPIGLAAMPVPLLMQSVTVTGVAGMNALAVLVFAMPALLAAGRDRKVGAALAVSLLAAHAGFGYFRLSAGEPEAARTVSVRIVQPNVDLFEKWDESVRSRIFADTLALSAQSSGTGEPPQLILWPETAVPFLFSDRPEALAAIGDILAKDQLLMTGTVRTEAGPAGADGPRYYNSVVAIDARGQIVDAVDKLHLVPFGEYLPLAGLLARLGIEQFVAGPTNFVAGSERHAIALPGSVSAVPFVCYEIIFPGLVAVDAASADIIVNVTNDAWFGDTPGPYQHFRQAQVRSVENGVPLLRAANTGISGVVDGRGRIVDALAMNTAGVIDVSVPVGAPRTAPVLRPGLVAAAIISLLGAFAAAAAARRRRR
jgi:apolipoprotein N-acyltransferase